jgi:hypothetical protein
MLERLAKVHPVPGHAPALPTYEPRTRTTSSLVSRQVYDHLTKGVQDGNIETWGFQLSKSGWLAGHPPPKPPAAFVCECVCVLRPAPFSSCLASFRAHLA